MDRLIYTAMSGASTALDQHATTTHNLANVSTTGFRAQLDALKAAPSPAPLKKSVTQVMDAVQRTDFSSGPIRQTGRDLDVAIQGAGWFVVQSNDGSEALTRGGALTISSNGILQTQSGLNVMGDSGPVAIPPEASQISISKDGTISFVNGSTSPALSVVVGQLRLANPPLADLERGQDGLFRLKSGQPLVAAPEVTLASGALEGSNVNVVDAMVKMIALGRQFDMNLQLLKNAESNETKASQVLNLA